ncbi:hypothetical protein PIB30_092763 [Stylosanthes scabra]|uniref:Secreted protein n=1 Tax=Stylosanthes scabra TaxID=79078 RepID=A0ABU6XST9_9FABA|nr:hypothetical protein [Stylosanthes scabra]
MSSVGLGSLGSLVWAQRCWAPSMRLVTLSRLRGVRIMVGLAPRRVVPRLCAGSVWGVAWCWGIRTLALDKVGACWAPRRASLTPRRWSWGGVPRRDPGRLGASVAGLMCECGARDVSVVGVL